MNEQERAKKAIDGTLAGLIADEQLMTRVLAAQVTKRERRIRISPGLVLAAVVLLGMAAFAMAGGSRTVNWFGETIPTEESTSVSYEAEPEVLAQMQRESDIENAYRRASNEPLMFRIAWPDNEAARRHTSSISLYVQDMAHFAQVMADAPHFPVPQWIPDGYEFAHGTISYAVKPDGEMVLFATDVTEDGLTVERYRAAEEGQIFPYFYALVFQHGDETLAIAATLSGGRNPATDTLTVADGHEAWTIASSQYDNVLFVEHDDCNILWARNDLDAELPYREQWSGEIMAYRDVIGTVQQNICQSALDAETLLRVFTGE